MASFYFSSDEGSPPEFDGEEPEYEMKQSSSLQMILASIAQERNRDQHNFVSEDPEYVLVNKDTFWTDLFTRHFLEEGGGTNDSRDDMLFYVRKTTAKSKFHIPQTEIEVFRRESRNKPGLGDCQIDWEETVYLNLILQQFEYHVTCAVCSRTGEKELQILKKFTQAFADIIVRDSEMVCVELVAKDRHGMFQSVVFLGSIRYDALKKVYDARASLTSRMAQRMSLGWFRGHKRVEFVRMRGPQAKGHAEMAVSRVKGSGPETPEQTPETENFRAEDFEQENQYVNRRMSDPSQSWHNFLRGSFKRSGIRKSRSETQNVDNIGTNGTTEVEAENIEDEFDEEAAHYDGFFGRSFGQAWGWFKERRRANCVALNSYLTYITLPWHRIIADSLEDEQQQPILV